MMRKILFIVLGVLVVVLVATRVHIHVPAPGPKPAASPEAGPAAPAATESGPDDMKLLCVAAGGVYEVRQPEKGPATLTHAARVGREGKPIATAAAILSLAPDGKDILYLTEDQGPDSGQLWRARAGGAPQSLAQGLRSPQGLLATGDHLYWTETRPSPAPGLACVPVLQPLSLVYAANPDGQGRKLLAVSESAEAHFPGKFLGERQGQVYWLQHFGQQYSRPLTTIWRAPVQGGAAEQMVRTEGAQDAVLAARTLYWTAPSEEMSPPLAGRTVRAMGLNGKATRTLTDWMSPDCRLVLAGRGLYCCDHSHVWRIPARLGEARPVAKPNLDPARLADYRGAVYGMTTGEKGNRLARVPLTWGARWRGLFGP